MSSRGVDPRAPSEVIAQNDLELGRVARIKPAECSHVTSAAHIRLEVGVCPSVVPALARWINARRLALALYEAVAMEQATGA